MNEAKKDKFVHDKQMIEQNIGLVRSSRTEKLKAARDSNRIKLDSINLTCSKQEE